MSVIMCYVKSEEAKNKEIQRK